MLFNGWRAMLAAARARFADLRVILVNAPEDMLAARLAARGRETAGDIAGRLRRATFALPEGIEATTVQNDATLDMGVARLLAALQLDSA